MDKIDRDTLSEWVLAGIRHDRYRKRAGDAYDKAREHFTPHQLGALHRKMRECCDECEYNEMKSGCY